MKQIRIAYIDFWPKLDQDNFILTRILKKHYDVIFDKQNPDFIFCSNFGTGYLNYKCPRILFLGEAKSPDFNVYDYTIAFDDIRFGDRYLQYPLFLTYEKNLELALHKHEKGRNYYLGKKKFCNTVVSNDLGCNVRDKYFDKLSEYKQVDSGGKHKNNLPDGQPVPDKLAFQSEYKFSFAFENSSFPGYVTEKIVDAWAAGTVPIYWGAPDIAAFFNPEAFIDCTKMKSVDEIIDRVREIDEDEEKYLAMMEAPILRTKTESEKTGSEKPESEKMEPEALAGSSVVTAEQSGSGSESILVKMMEEKYLEDFLTHIFDQEPEEAKRRSSAFTMWGYNHEHHLQQWKKLEDQKWFQWARRNIKH